MSTNLNNASTSCVVDTSNDLLSTYRTPFYLHNSKGFASSVDDVIATLRYAGCKATSDEIAHQYSVVCKDFAAFLDLVRTLHKDDTTCDEEISAALAELNASRSQPLSVSDLKRILSNFGDRLSPEIVHLPPLPSLREIIRIYGLRAQKQLSQNFLLQPASLNGFVKCAGNLKGAYVLEVGPGPGGLTRTILQCRPSHLVVVELDRRFLPGLEQLRLAAAEMNIRMDIYRQDILNFNAENIFPAEIRQGAESWGHSSGLVKPADFMLNSLRTSADSTALIPAPSHRIRVIGNLPFNISTPLLSQWLEDIAERRGLWTYGRVPLILSFQKEVGQRLVADVWDEQRSRLSIMAQAYCKVEYMKDIPGTAFLPKPKVDVAVIRLTPLAEPLIPVRFPYVQKLVRLAFQFRNKQVVRCLETLFPSDRPDLVVQLFKEAGVQPVKRPTQLTMPEFRDLCIVYERICLTNPGLFDFGYQDRANLPLWWQRKHIQRSVLGTEHALTAGYVRSKMYE